MILLLFKNPQRTYNLFLSIIGPDVDEFCVKLLISLNALPGQFVVEKYVPVNTTHKYHIYILNHRKQTAMRYESLINLVSSDNTFVDVGDKVYIILSR